MMKYSVQKRAFTLIEIIVVLIVLGILVAIAAPSYFSWIKRSQAAEAFASLLSMRPQFVSCLRSHPDATQCFSASASCSATYMYINPDGSTVSGPIDRCFDVIDPGSPNFHYKFFNSQIYPSIGGEYVIDLDPKSWTIVAYSGSESDGNSVTISGDSADTQGHCFGLGLFKGIC